MYRMLLTHLLAHHMRSFRHTRPPVLAPLNRHRSYIQSSSHIHCCISRHGDLSIHGRSYTHRGNLSHKQNHPSLRYPRTRKSRCRHSYSLSQGILYRMDEKVDVGSLVSSCPHQFYSHQSLAHQSTPVVPSNRRDPPCILSMSCCQSKCYTRS